MSKFLPNTLLVFLLHSETQINVSKKLHKNKDPNDFNKLCI